MTPSKCPGSGVLVREEHTVHGRSQCPNCGYFQATNPAQGYEGWRFLATHIALATTKAATR